MSPCAQARDSASALGCLSHVTLLRTFLWRHANQILSRASDCTGAELIVPPAVQI